MHFNLVLIYFTVICSGSQQLTLKKKNLRRKTNFMGAENEDIRKTDKITSCVCALACIHAHVCTHVCHDMKL